MKGCAYLLGTTLLAASVAASVGCGSSRESDSPSNAQPSTTAGPTATASAITLQATATAEPVIEPKATDKPITQPSVLNMPPQCDVPEGQRTYLGSIAAKEDILSIKQIDNAGQLLLAMKVKEGAEIHSPSQITAEVLSFGRGNEVNAVTLIYDNTVQVGYRFSGEIRGDLKKGDALRNSVLTVAGGELVALGIGDFNLGVFLYKVKTPEGTTPFLLLCATADGDLYFQTQ